ncbi:MAG TPA: enoyl-CoA hydratase-related protein [Nitrososphaera sp.]|jgi:3-hydroxypropionyl-coenzyme A dehydratase|nr:enoyl-CoA hydratase-related protein [Nitrososphaera sp.]
MAIISNLVFNHSLLVKTNKILLKRNAAYSYNMSTMKYIQLEPQGDIAILRINRPEALNAMNVDVISELSKMIDILAADDSIKAVVITGAGERSFCAGADISYMVNIDPMQAERYATSAQDVINRIDRLEKPVIAAVNGFALGGGCELAMACDIRIASSNAKIGQPEVTIGIPPGWGGTQRLMRLIGPAKAKELIFTGKMIMADEAYQIGLVNKVISLGPDDKLPPEVPKGDAAKEKERANEIAKILNKKLMDQCIALAKEIAKNSFVAVKVSKKLINRGMDTDLETGLRLEIYGWALCFAHEDRQKMMSAFLNKSKK